MAVQNIHLVNGFVRQAFVNIVKESDLSVCGVVETWMKNKCEIMQGELFGTEWEWFGKGRIGRRGGGLGFMVRRELKPRIPKASTENILWLEFERGEKWYLAVVYLAPKVPVGDKLATLAELKSGIVEFTKTSGDGGFQL